MSRHFNEDTPKTLRYMREVFAPEDALLTELAQHLITQNIAIQIGPEEGKILQLLIRMNYIETVVELGTLGGYSSIWMARALPADGHVYTIEKEPENAKLAQSFIDRSEVGHKISIVVGDGHEMIRTLDARGPFDMIFIDADKPGYTDYLDWAEKNIRKGGLIVGDNTLLFDAVVEDAPPAGTSAAAWNAMREFNTRLADPKKYHAAMLPTKEGMTVAVKLF